MIKFDLPKNQSSIIKVMGVGGGGSNAVTHMFNQGIRGVDFILCNTDTQAMEASPVPTKLQLGNKGLGAGSIPAVGREAALEKSDEIKEILAKNTQMLFITAGMGGGTGTGAAPVISAIARELDILTVGIVTLPFSFEGRKRRLQAEEGIEELKKHVDTLLMIVNDKLRVLHGDLKLSEAFQEADNILATAARGIAEIITVTGYINVDFEDVKTVMKGSGKAIMGSGAAEGEDRAVKAVEMALSSPLLNDNNISGAGDILLYIASGKDEISMDEVIQITDFIQREAGPNAEIIWGNGVDGNLENKISISLVATGFDSRADELNKNKKIFNLKDGIKDEPIAGVNEFKKPEKIELIEKAEEKEHPVNEPAPENEESQTIVFDLLSGEKKLKEKPVTNLAETETKHLKPEMKEEKQKETEKIDEEVDVEKEEDEVKKEIVFKLENKEEKKVPREFRAPQPSGPGEHDDLERKAKERINKLKDLSIKLRTPGGLSELENEPAYVRKNLKIEDTPASDESQVSKYTLSEGKENDTVIKSNNKYLHDKAD